MEHSRTGARGFSRIALLLIVAVAGAPALLADEGEEDQRYLAPTVTGETGLFTIFTGQTLPAKKWSFGIYYNNWDRLVAPSEFLEGFGFDDEWDYDHNRLSASVGYGITDRFEVSLMAPFEDFEASGDNQGGALNGHTFVEDIDASGFGNVRLAAKVRLMGEHDGANVLAFNAFVEAPTGDDEEGVVTGATGFGAGIAYTHKIFSLNVGAHIPGNADEQDVSGEALIGFGVAVPVGDNFDWISEVQGTFYLDSDYAPDDNIDLTTGGRVWFGDDSNWAFNFGLRTDLAQLGDSDKFCPLGGLVGLTYFPRARHKVEEKKEEVVTARAPEPPKPLPPPPAPAPKAEIRIECEFKAGSARVDNICKARLDEIALKMKQDTSLRAHISGYAPGANGMKLSKLRAENTKTFLMERHRFDASRFSVEGYGSAEPGDRIVIVLKSE